MAEIDAAETTARSTAREHTENIILDHLKQWPTTATEIAEIYQLSLVYTQQVIRRLRREGKIVLTGRWNNRAAVYRVAKRKGVKCA